LNIVHRSRNHYQKVEAKRRGKRNAKQESLLRRGLNSMLKGNKGITGVRGGEANEGAAFARADSGGAAVRKFHSSTR